MAEPQATDGPAPPYPGVCDPVRLRALEQTGLGTDPDPEMERLAAWVRRALGVPVALVSLVQAQQQVFPGMVGLPEPWAGKRSTPLSHSFCRHVVETAAPLVIPDAREHPLVRDNLAVPDLGVVAYAGMPLTDGAGTVLGSLCAIDTEPRAWRDDEIDTLREIARSCSTDLRLRLAQYDAARDGERRDRDERAQRRALERSQTLLAASQSFLRALTVEEVRAGIDEVVDAVLRPAHLDVVLSGEHGRLRHLAAGPGAEDEVGPVTRLLAGTAVREGRIVHHADREDLDAHAPPAARAAVRALGLHTVVAVPLPGPGGSSGAVVLGWTRPGPVDPADLVGLSTIAGSAGRALDRARVLHHRTSVAHELQNAMLTTLPVVAGLTTAARYQPADSREHVGGDWFDVAPLLDPARPHEQNVVVSVGDIVGHTLQAATVMGQARSMLRQAAWDHPAGPPSRVVAAFETASTGLGLHAVGTAVLAQLTRSAGRGWTMRWSNAGHPPPVLLLPDGTTRLLTEHDPLFGFGLTAERPRRDHGCAVPPGALLFLYSDGLVERRGEDIDDGIDELLALLDGLRGSAPREIVDAAVETLAREAPDDVVALAIRFAAQP